MEGLEKDRAALAWFSAAWDDYVNSLPLLLPVLLTQALISAGSFYILGRWQSIYAAMPYMLLVVTPVTTGANLVYIKLARGSGARFTDLFSAFPVYPRALAVSVALGLLTTGGALMFIIPGVILYLTYVFSEYAVVDRRTGIKESFLLSAAVTRGWKTRLLPVVLLTIVISYAAPDIYIISGGFSNPSTSLDLRPWTIASSALKTLVFLPWLNLAMARAYNLLLSLPPEREEAPAEDA